MKKAALGGGVAAAVWAAPRVEGLKLVPDYAAAVTGVAATYYLWGTGDDPDNFPTYGSLVPSTPPGGPSFKYLAKADGTPAASINDKTKYYTWDTATDPPDLMGMGTLYLWTNVIESGDSYTAGLFDCPDTADPWDNGWYRWCVGGTHSRFRDRHPRLRRVHRVLRLTVVNNENASNADMTVRFNSASVGASRIVIS